MARRGPDNDAIGDMLVAKHVTLRYKTAETAWAWKYAANIVDANGRRHIASGARLFIANGRNEQCDRRVKQQALSSYGSYNSMASTTNIDKASISRKHHQ